MCCIRHIQSPATLRTMYIIVNSNLFRHHHVLFTHDIFWHIQIAGKCLHVENRAIFKMLPYSKFWHISDTRFIENSVKHLIWRELKGYYSSATSHLRGLTRLWTCLCLKKCWAPRTVTLSYILYLAYWEPKHIQDPVYLGIFKHIQ